MLSRFNIWYLSSFFISLIVVVPILMIFGSFFETTTEYSSILKETFLLDYIFNTELISNILLGFFVSLSVLLGDLFFSYLKR